MTSTSSLTKPIRDANATWVEPKFLAEVEYRDVTTDGLLRAATFKGLTKGNRPFLKSFSPFRSSICPDVRSEVARTKAL